MYRHGQPLTSALRALQPAHHLVIRHVSVAVLGQLFERHEAGVPAVATRCAKEHAAAFGYGREGGHGGAVGERSMCSVTLNEVDQVTSVKGEIEDIAAITRL